MQAGCALLFALEGWRLGEGGVSHGWAGSLLGGRWPERPVGETGRDGAGPGQERGGADQRSVEPRNAPGEFTWRSDMSDSPSWIIAGKPMIRGKTIGC